MKLRSLKIVFSFLLICLYSIVSAQYTIPEKPKTLYPVYDEAGLLTPQEKDQLNDKLIKFSDSTSTEIEVIIIPSTKGEDINFLATMFGEKWGIGQKGVDNGVVFLIATEDRKMAIQQGRAVEQYLTASVAGQIIDYIVAPNFKQGLWYEGINRGTSAIMETVQGKFKPLVTQSTDSGDDSGIFTIMIIAFVIFIILIIIIKNKGGGGGGGFNDDDDVIITRRGRRNYPGGFFPFPGSFGGGGFGGGSSGGGFGGFGGGGSFGGGGASGGW